MYKVLVLGAGKIGGAIVDMLAATGDYAVTVADRDPTFLALIDERRAQKLQLDLSDRAALAQAMAGQAAVLSALPFFLNPLVAQVAGELPITSRS